MTTLAFVLVCFAFVFFILAGVPFTDPRSPRLVAWGLACFALAYIVTHLPK